MIKFFYKTMGKGELQSSGETPQRQEINGGTWHQNSEADIEKTGLKGIYTLESKILPTGLNEQITYYVDTDDRVKSRVNRTRDHIVGKGVYSTQGRIANRWSLDIETVADIQKRIGEKVEIIIDSSGNGRDTLRYSPIRQISRRTRQ